MNAYLGTFGHSPEYQPPAGGGLIANYFLVLMETPEDLSRVLDAAESEADQGGETDLDRAVRELLPYLKELWATLSRSRDYHLKQAAAPPSGPGESRELRARLDSGVDLHAKIFADYQGFAATYELFRTALQREGAERRQRDIQAMLESGLTLRPAMLEALDAGQALQDFLNSRQVATGALAGLKPEELAPFHKNFQARSAFLEASAATGASDRERLPAEGLAEFIAQLRLARATAEALAKAEPQYQTDGSPEALARELGRLVDIYNQME